MAGIRKHVYLLVFGITLLIYLCFPEASGLSCVVCDSKFNSHCNDDVYDPVPGTQEVEVWNNCTVCVSYTIYDTDNTTIQGYVKDCEFEEDIIGCSTYTFDGSIVDVCLCDTDFCAQKDNSDQVINDYVTSSASSDDSTPLGTGATQKESKYNEKVQINDKASTYNDSDSLSYKEYAPGFKGSTNTYPTTSETSTSMQHLTMENDISGYVENKKDETNTDGYPKDAFAAVVIEYTTKSTEDTNHASKQCSGIVNLIVPISTLAYYFYLTLRGSD